MSNHARGLWGYSGQTPGGKPLTIQATGIGAPSAVAVLADLAKLGTRCAVRVGTCTGLDAQARVGELLLVAEAVAAGGSASSFGVVPGTALRPDPILFERLRAELDPQCRPVRVASFDALPVDPAATATDVVAADMQTAALLARGPELGIAAAALLVVTDLAAGGPRLSDEALEDVAKLAGRVASAVLSG